MPNKKYYCDNELGEPVMRDVNRYYPIALEPSDPPLWVQGLWIVGIAGASICVVIMLFAWVAK